MRLARLIITALGVGLSCLAGAQTDRLRFENVSAGLGTLHWGVDYAMEDHLGFLWLGTETGLFRYDGYQLVGFRHNVHDSTSISSYGVHHMVEDRDGRIWVSTVYGINRMDRRTGRFERYRPYDEPESTKSTNIIRWLHVDQDNRLLAVGRENFYLFHRDTGKFQLIRQEDDPARLHNVAAIHETTDGTIWIATSEGVLRMERGDTTFHWLNPMADLDAGYSTINQITDAEDGALWLATVSGMVWYDPASDQVATGRIPLEFRKQRVDALLKSRRGHLWMAFNRGGVGLLNPDGSYQVFRHYDDDMTSLPDDNVQCFVEDRHGNIWIGTHSGLVKVPLEYSGIRFLQNTNAIQHQANHVRYIFVDAGGALWTKTARGIYRLPAGQHTASPVTVVPGNNEPVFGDWIHQDPEGGIWIPVDSMGIWRQRQGANTFIPLPLDDRLRYTHVNKIIQDHADPDVLWVGTSNGLCRLIASSLTGTWYAPRTQIPELRSDRVIVFEQSGEALWHYYTFDNSLGRFNKKTGTFELFRPPQDQQYVLEGVVRDIDVSANGKVWVATSFGLTEFDSGTKQYRIHTTREGLQENSLYAVIVDHKDRVWVTGDQFFARFDQDSGTFRNYSSVQQVKNFLSKSAHLGPDGSIYFGGQNGIYTFHPDSIRIDSTAPEVVLTNFKVKDSTYLLDEAFEYVRNIVLEHDQNDLTFEFAGLHYFDPGLNQYRCMLEGYDRTWRNLGNVRTANYTNLNPGTYTFRGQAANRDGIWSEDGLAITLQILPHFTQTNWFRVLVALVIALILYFFYKVWQNQQMLRRQKTLAEQAAEYRMQFLSHVSHEIRTPMNAIIGLSGLAKETPLDEKQREYVTAIERSSQDLLEIINELLDHSKLESGKFSLAKEPFTLSDVTNQIEAIFDPLAREKDLSFSVSVHDDVPEYLVGDGLRLRQILTNLLGNAVKYTEQGKVTLVVSVATQASEQCALRFKVDDTGVGIAPEDLEHVFDRFADQRKRPEVAGTGLGMYITRQLVERQGGSISLASTVGTGTTVEVTLPFGVVAQVPQSKAPAAQYDFGDIHILLVDDAPFNHLVMTEMIRKRIPHARVALASDGREALDLVTRDQFDVIVMDARMPGMDGKTATREIREMAGPIAHIPILGATAGAMPEQVQECLDSGMDDVVTKPVQIDTLIEKLYQLTQQVEK